MGEHAQDAKHDFLDAIERVDKFIRGGSRDIESVADIVDEHGAIPHEIPIFGSFSEQDLINDLTRAERDFFKWCLEERDRRDVVHYWRSGDKLFLPAEMTDAHLTNAIAYAERQGITGPIVEQMKAERYMRIGRAHDTTSKQAEG